MQIIIILKIFNDFFACKIVLDANHHYPESIPKFFRLQNCVRRKSSLSRKYSKTFLPARLSWPQIILVLETFKGFVACKFVLAANHQYPGNIQKLFRQQNCLICKSSLSWKYSKTFSPAKLSSTQLIIILKTVKNFSPAKLSQPQIIIILKLFKDFFASNIVLAANNLYAENIQTLFRLQKCLRRKSSSYWKHSKTFSPAKLS